MDFNVNRPQTAGTGNTPAFSDNESPSRPLRFEAPKDTVTFSGARRDDDGLKIESIAEFYRVLDTFDSPEVISEKYKAGVSRERTAEEVKADGDKAAALVKFLTTEEGKKVCLTVEPFNNIRGYRKVSIDGTPVSFVLTYARQNVDPSKSSEIPMLSIWHKGIHDRYAVYDTQRQITDDYKTGGEHGSASDQAEETAELFEQVTLFNEP